MTGGSSSRIKWGLALVVVLLILKAGLDPLFQWRDSMMTDIQRLKGTIAKKEALLQHRDTLEEQRKMAKASLEKLAGMYVTDYKDAQALQLGLQQTIEALAKKHNIAIERTDWLPVLPGKVLKAPVKVRFSGLPDNVLAFLSNLENQHTFVAIDILKLYAKPDMPELTGEIDVAAYGVDNALLFQNSLEKPLDQQS